MAYQATQSPVLEAQLQVQTLLLPFTITASATAANVVVTPYNSEVLFYKTEGTDTLTEAAGFLSAGETAPTATGADDSDGIFYLGIKVSEPIAKIVGATLAQVGGTEVIGCVLGNTTGLTADGDKLVLKFDSGVNLSTTSYAGYVQVNYIV